MSAFLVDGATLDAAVSAIWDFATDGRGVLTRPLVVAHVVVNERADLQKLATALYAMNVVAIDERYPENGDAVPLHRFKQIDGLSRVFGVKQVQCLHYQCCEGSVCESDLFKALEQLIALMHEKIVSSLPEWSAAPWGCNEAQVNRRVVSLSGLAKRS